MAFQDNPFLGGGSPWEVPWGQLYGEASYHTLSKYSMFVVIIVVVKVVEVTVVWVVVAIAVVVIVVPVHESCLSRVCT